MDRSLTMLFPFMNMHEKVAHHRRDGVHTQTIVVGPTTPGEASVPGPTVLMLLKPLPPPGSYHPDFTEPFLPLTMIFPSSPTPYEEKAGLGNSFLSYFSD